MRAAIRHQRTGLRRSSWRSLALALVVYVAVALPAGIQRRWVLNPDGISYIQLATHLAEGRFADSVSGYWSPLLIWSLAPLRYLGVDGPIAARLVLGVWGAVCVVAAWAFLRRFARLSWRWEALVLALVALTTAIWTTEFICPDTLLAATLLAYITSALSPRLLRRPSTQLAAGMLGSVTYLAKAYGLPFFLAHFTFTLVLRGCARRRPGTWKTVAGAWATGLLGFFLIAGPWIAVLSHHYGKLTFSTTARIAHTVVGPPGEIRAHPLHLLYHVPPGRLSSWEAPECMEYHPWSPFESWAYFRYQLEQMNRTRVRILENMRAFDVFGLSLAGFFLFPLAALAGRRRLYAVRYIWLLGTVGIYAGGFLPVYYSNRYLMPLIWSLCCIQFFVAWFMLRRQLGLWRPRPSRRTRWIWGLLTVLCVWSFASVPGGHARRAIWPPEYKRHPTWTPWDGAEQLRRLGCRGPMAVTSRKDWPLGLYLSYCWGQPFAGVATAKTVEQVRALLEEYHIQTLVVTLSWRHSKTWLDGTQVRWKQAAVIRRGAAGPIYVFVPEPAGAPSTRAAPE